MPGRSCRASRNLPPGRQQAKQKCPFSATPNTEFDANNDTACHLDLRMKNRSLWLDNDMIVKDGEVIPENM